MDQRTTVPRMHRERRATSGPRPSRRGEPQAPSCPARERRKAPLDADTHDGWAHILTPAQQRRLVPEAGRETAVWAGRGGTEATAEAEAAAGWAGQGAGPEGGETLKRKQQQAEPL
jgi:hypothetical protein